MKILCISDEIDPLVYSLNAKKRFSDIDLVISSGDLPGRYYEFIISTLNKPLLYVNGNHNGIHKSENCFNRGLMDDGSDDYFGECIDGKVIYLKKFDLIVAGIGGSMRYNTGPDQYSEKAQRRRIARMAPTLLYNKLAHGRFVDIAVTHAAPLGINDGDDICHRGFECFNRFMELYKPTCLLHGHMHLPDMNKRPVTEAANGTKVINVYKSYIMEINR